MSPELTLRPLLSVQDERRPHQQPHRVAGANAPAFVERWIFRLDGRGKFLVSPELTLRPLLSDAVRRTRPPDSAVCRRS